MDLSLARALRIASSSCVAFAGAGGKTTAMFQLARELPPPVIVTATTHLGAWQTTLADQHIITETPEPLEQMEHGPSGVILITGKINDDRTAPVSDTLLEWLHQFCEHHSIPLLIEADGAREKPLKAWAEHEPPIPEFVEHVVQVLGLSVLGQPLHDELVHHADRFSKLSGIKIGDKITSDGLVRVLLHPEGGSKNIPAGAQKTVLLNQADTPELQSAAQGMSQWLLEGFNSVIISSLKQGRIFAAYEPVAGIILAAGESKRFGEPKQLLDWKGQPFVRVVAETALNSGLSPIIVVTGSNAEQVEAAIQDLDVTIARNQNWASGQGNSIRQGVNALNKIRNRVLDVQQNASNSRLGVGGAIFLLADQPQVTTTVLCALVETHAQGLHPIVAPLVMDQRANPVLFDRVTFPDLMNIEGDVGGRAIFHRHRVEYLPWHDDRLLLDVDTPDQYQRLVSDGDL
jgi:molybdenum cofactor cytidylyltransferase